MTFTLLGDTGSAVEPHIGSGVAVPIGGPPGVPLGQIVALFHGHEPPTEPQVDELERLAARAAPIVAAAPDGAERRRNGRARPSHRACHPAALPRAPRPRGRERSSARSAAGAARARHRRLPIGERARRPDRRRCRVLALATAVEAVAPPSAVDVPDRRRRLAVILPGSNRLEVELVLSPHPRGTPRSRARPRAGRDGFVRCRGADARRRCAQAVRTGRPCSARGAPPRAGRVDAPGRDVTEQG